MNRDPIGAADDSSGERSSYKRVSLSGFVAQPAVGAYCASKFALEALSDSLCMEMQPSGVEVIVVQPGQFSTPIHNKIVQAFGEDEAAGRSRRKLSTLSSPR